MVWAYNLINYQVEAEGWSVSVVGLDLNFDRYAEADVDAKWS